MLTTRLTSWPIVRGYLIWATCFDFRYSMEDCESRLAALYHHNT